MNVGNDLVCLNDSNLSKFNPRFKERILSIEEKQYLEQSQIKELIWYFWSAKESAYKYLKQFNPGLKFSPSKFVVNFDEKKVTYEEHVIDINYQIKPHWIYCYTTHENLNVSNFVQMKHTHSDQSHAVRSLAIAKLASLFHIESHNIIIHKNLVGAPLAKYNGRDLPVVLSFTHDGPYIGVAIGQRSYTIQ